MSLICAHSFGKLKIKLLLSRCFAHHENIVTICCNKSHYRATGKKAKEKDKTPAFAYASERTKKMLNFRFQVSEV